MTDEYRNEEKETEALLAGEIISNFDEAGRRINIGNTGRYQGGQTDYNTGTGFFLGMSSGVFKFSIGNPTGNYMTWDGSTLTIAGTITASTFQTAATGQRVTINESNNNLLKFYDSADNLLITLGTSSGYAQTFALNSTVSNGIIMTSAVSGFAISYTNSLSNLSGNAGITVSLTGTSNTAAAFRVTNNGTTGAQGVLITTTGAATGIYLDHQSTANAITIAGGSSIFTALDISSSFSSGSPSSIIIATTVSSSGSPTGAKITISTASGNPTAFDLNLSAGAGQNSYFFKHPGNQGIIVDSAIAGGATQDKKVRVLIGSSVYFIPLYDA